MQFDQIKNKQLSRDFLLKIATLFSKRLRGIVFVLFLILAGYCFYLWYAFAYHPSWSSDQKSAYREAHDTEVTFDTEKFKAIVAKKHARESQYQEKIDTSADIFRLK
ncbi:MAG: hypothetical protein WA064_02090 [Candidatus Moraniibacteriota bacterium]